jgi:sugar lactone lactonase YvrE
MQTQAELRIDSHSLVGEGPIWDGKKEVLYWVDIMGHKLHIYDPVGDVNTTLGVGQPVGTVVPRA